MGQGTFRGYLKNAWSQSREDLTGRHDAIKYFPPTDGGIFGIACRNQVDVEPAREWESANDVPACHQKRRGRSNRIQPGAFDDFLTVFRGI